MAAKTEWWIQVVWLVLILTAATLLIQAAMLASGKKCAKWNKKYNIWTQQWVDTSPCLQFAD